MAAAAREMLTRCRRGVFVEGPTRVRLILPSGRMFPSLRFVFAETARLREREHVEIISNFVSKVIATCTTGAASEDSCYSAIEALFSGLDNSIKAMTEAKRVACGAPDFIVQRGEMVIGHVEVRGIGIRLCCMEDVDRNQQERYRNALPNLIYTNGLDWDLYRNGELVASVTIVDDMTDIRPNPEQFVKLEMLLRKFVAQRLQPITSPRALAEIVAAKAMLVKEVLQKAVKADEHVQTKLSDQYSAFKKQLIHDITAEEFADVCAETIACGMFAARLHYQTPDTFKRQDALRCLPMSDPLLRSLFGYICGENLDDRIAWVIDDLAAVFQVVDVRKIMEGSGKLTGQNDPLLHFHEMFLAACNPVRRKARGVWYTPEPVVSFIVRAVGEVLKSEFGLPDGLADTSRINIDSSTGQTDIHRVQILDPATGTGTFLAEVIKQIAPKVEGVAPCMRSSYIETEIIPRLHGFELLIASYAMCHMKIDMLLQEMGYKPAGTSPRLSVHLTNALQEGEPANHNLPFAQWRSKEVKQANAVRRDMPILCVIGNPPYLGEEGRSEGWLGDLMEDYKKEPGGKKKLDERNPKWLNDLYIKFIRLSSHLISKNGEGVLGFVTNHNYLDAPTFRGMRWHLQKNFDKIWILDLHGNSKKKEISPGGKTDKNVFDIQQGVSIIVAVKKNDGGDGMAEVRHGELWGTRDEKYRALLKAPSIASLAPTRLDPHPHYQMFYPIDNSVLDAYDKGFSLGDFFVEQQIGLTTSRDHLAVDFTAARLIEKLSFFTDPSRTDDEVRQRFFGAKRGIDGRPAGDTASWSLSLARQNLSKIDWRECIRAVDYRPFDKRVICYSDIILERPRAEIIPQLFHEENFALSFNRKIDEARPFTDCFVFANAVQLHSLSIKESNYFAPIYTYLREGEFDTSRRVNFDPKLVRKLESLAKHGVHGMAGEVDVFDYIYGVLHCPAYRETYREFIKIDVPRIPWPVTPDEFWDVSFKGTTLRKLHLMDKATVGLTPSHLTGEGDNVVRDPRLENGEIWINATQCFDCAIAESWHCNIGGYAPAQKWLGDRMGVSLTVDDVKHYLRLLKVLSETARVMGEIRMTLAGHRPA